MDPAWVVFLNQYLNVLVWYDKLIDAGAWFEASCLPILGVCFLLRTRQALSSPATHVYWPVVILQRTFVD